MSTPVVTNVRLPADLLRDARILARGHGLSLSAFARELLRAYTHQVKVQGRADASRIDLGRPRDAEPIWSLQPFRSARTREKTQKKEDARPEPV